ncbi:pirin family protein [Vulgatibacter incomptus]|uniref:Pirin-like protein YhhW n=1 Tax=Vulgatibacter incomptus TaxID=1391653 RepID=A0A0K1PHW3_9BACT|nr:pirin family protein [Vulgatibacter incomptus]AKU92699.1 Pirin-like protein YhhW [Vulgatibacter incomptus]
MSEELDERISRRAFVKAASGWLALTALGCNPSPGVPPVADPKHRPLSSLPTTKLSWLHLRDHFVATVGPNAGAGRPFGPLLVLADATFAPSSRFPLHPHREMEILSLVVRGELSHHGDQEHGATLRARQAQLISARNGMVHAEGNDTDGETHMLQIWFRPNEHGGEARYFHREIPFAPAGGRHLVAGDDGMPMRSPAKVWWLDLVAGREERLDVAPRRAGYLLAMDAPVALTSGLRLEKGEGAEVHAGSVAVAAATEAAAALWIEVSADA